MADVLHKTADPTDYRRSVHTPDYPAADWFHNPNVSAVSAVPLKYWKRPLTDPVQEMNAAEKAAVDAAAAAVATAADRTERKKDIDRRHFTAVAKVLIDELNVLRALHGLPDRTLAQAKNAIKNHINNN